MKDKRLEIANNILKELAKLEKFEDALQTFSTVIVWCCINQEDVTSNKVKWIKLVIKHLKFYIQKIQKGEF